MKRQLVAVFAVFLVGAESAGADARARRGAEPALLELAWAWTAPGEEIGVHGFELADVDGDGRDEILAASWTDYWYQLGLDEGLEQEWTSLPVESGIQAFIVVSPTPGTHEVLLASNDQLLVYDAASKLQLREFPAGISDLVRLAAADLDNDGDLEVVACSEQDLVVLDYTTGAGVAMAPGLGCFDLVLGQTDADDQLEIAIATGYQGTLLLDSLSFVVQWSDPDHWSWALDVVDADGNALQELVLGFEEDGVGHLVVVDPRSSQAVWQRYWSGPAGLAVADVVGDPTPEIIYGDDGPSPLIVVGAATGNVLIEAESWTDSVDRILVGQLDEDDAKEIAWISGSGSTAHDEVAALDLTSLELEGITQVLTGGFPSLSPSQLAPGASREVLAAARYASGFRLGTFLVFDAPTGNLTRTGQLPPDLDGYYSSVDAAVATNFDSDSQQEICMALNEGGSDAALLCLDGLTEQVEWFATLAGDTSIVALELAELDGDPLPELLFATRGWPPAPIAAVWALEAENGWLKWRSADLGPEMGWLAGYGYLRLGDFDFDGSAEVAAGWRGGGLAILTAATGATEAIAGDLWLAALDVGNVDADPEPDVVLGDEYGVVSVIDPQTGQIETTLLQAPWSIQGLALADFDRDTVTDVVVGVGSFVQLYDGATLALEWTSPYLGDTTEAKALIATDFDGDGSPELAVDFYSGIALFEIPDQPIFGDGFETGDTSAWSLAIP